jgi:transcriptional regulator with XRE-family HTH domain
MHSSAQELLVPPVRLGRILHDARIDAGDSIDALVSRCGLAYDDTFFDAVESGRAPLDEATVRWLAALYDVKVDQLVPQRARLVIDLEEGSVRIGAAASLIEPMPDDVLAKYLALVYELRGIRVGAPLKIRELDLDVLSRALTMRSREVRSRLHTLMSGDPEPLEGSRRRLRGRLVVPVAGILVAVTAVGGLLFERASDDPAPSQPRPAVIDASAASAVASSTIMSGTAPSGAEATVDIGEPAVLVRPNG